MRIIISIIVFAFVFITGMVIDAAPAACIDDPKLEFHVGKKKRNCKWVSKNTKSNDGVLVPNWATIGVSAGKIVHTGGGFSGSGTSQYVYGAEAARMTF